MCFDAGPYGAGTTEIDCAWVIADRDETCHVNVGCSDNTTCPGAGFEPKYEVGPGRYCLPRFLPDGIGAVQVEPNISSPPRPLVLRRGR